MNIIPRERPEVISGWVALIRQSFQDCADALAKSADTGKRKDIAAWKDKAGVLEVYCVGHMRSILAELEARQADVAERDAALGVARRAILKAAQDTLWCDDVPAQTVLDRIDAIAGGQRDLPGMPADESLLASAVRCAKPQGRGRKPRWVAVMDTLAVGSNCAWSLCTRFGFDPDELVCRR